MFRFMSVGWIACGFIFQYLYYGEASLALVSTWLVVIFWPFVLAWIIFIWILWLLCVLAAVWLFLSFVNHAFPGRFGLSKDLFRLPWV